MATQDRKTDWIHKSVLLQEMVKGLDIEEGGVIVDCTLNTGGHSELVLSLYPSVRVIGIDMDSEAIAKARARLAEYGNRFEAFKSNFRNLDKVLEDAGVDQVSGFMFDLGWSSDQLELSGRGFSFQRDEPLLMTYEAHPKDDVTARMIVNEWGEDTIETLIKNYGEEDHATRIAKAIIEARKTKPIETTGELREIIWNAVPPYYRNHKIHPATKTFQALRITVNDEFGALKEALRKAYDHTQKESRIAVISFHSSEDRIVKEWSKELAKQGQALLITKKPIAPTAKEIKSNPRARSAKLRIIQKI